MNHLRLLVGLFGALAVGMPGRAEPPKAGPCPKGTWCCPVPLLGCPDNYCRKPCPRIWCLTCGVPDDYCRKPGPRTWCLPCGVLDDYCRKACPDLCLPLCPDYYHCGGPPPTLPGLATPPPTHKMTQVGDQPGTNTQPVSGGVPPPPQ